METSDKRDRKIRLNWKWHCW